MKISSVALVCLVVMITGVASARPRVPHNTARPEITGTAQQGERLTVDRGSWRGAKPLSFSFGWKRCGLYPRRVRADTPLGYWRMGDPSGPRMVDSSGNQSHGAYGDGVHLLMPGALRADSDRAGWIEHAAVRQKSSAPLAFGGGNDFSVEFWARVGGARTEGATILSFGDVSVGYDTDAVPRLSVGGLSLPASRAAALSPDGFRHYVAAYGSSSGTLTWHVDGLNDTTHVAAIDLPDASSALIGGPGTGATVLDELAIYDRALTADRIAAHVHAGTKGCRGIGARGRRYDVRRLDVGTSVRAVVRARNSAGSTRRASRRTPVVAPAGAPLEIPSPETGLRLPEQAPVGQRVWLDAGFWAGTSPIGFGLRWWRCSAEVCAKVAWGRPFYDPAPSEVGSRLRAVVVARNAAGTTRVSAETTVVNPDEPAPQPSPSPSPSDTPAMRIAAAGDIACDPASPHFNDGRGTATDCRQMATSDLVVGAGVDAVLLPGDIQYECGSAEAYARSYDPSWGRLKHITWPAPGNHEYATEIEGTHTACEQAGAAYFDYFGNRAVGPGGYYSFDLGSWHIIALNSQCWATGVGGCAAGSPQERWLNSDLAANPTRCTLAYWHEPRFSSSKYGNDARSAAFWDALYASGADIVLNGHAHLYERLAPQDPSGNRKANGIRQFIVGTGGKSLHPLADTIHPNSEVRRADTFGVLQMILHPTSYSWRFMPLGGGSFDEGSASCN